MLLVGGRCLYTLGGVKLVVNDGVLLWPHFSGGSDLMYSTHCLTALMRCWRFCSCFASRVSGAFESLILVFDAEARYSLFEAGETKACLEQCVEVDRVFDILLCAEMEFVATWSSKDPIGAVSPLSWALIVFSSDARSNEGNSLTGRVRREDSS